LSHVGIFPGRCYPIPAREITQEELMMVIDFTMYKFVPRTHISTYFIAFLMGDPQTNIGQWLDILTNDIYWTLFWEAKLTFFFNLNVIKFRMRHALFLLNINNHCFSIGCSSSSSSKISIKYFFS
jgi:hypothetical protein